MTQPLAQDMAIAMAIATCIAMDMSLAMATSLVLVCTEASKKSLSSVKLRTFDGDEIHTEVAPTGKHITPISQTYFMAKVMAIAIAMAITLAMAMGHGQ